LRENAFWLVQRNGGTSR